MDTVIVMLAVNGLLATGHTLQPQATATAVVFVCEHGAVKSVVATVYFNKLAVERGLPVRATFRGTSPQDSLSVRAVDGLKADGVAIPSGKPAAINDKDVAEQLLDELQATGKNQKGA